MFAMESGISFQHTAQVRGIQGGENEQKFDLNQISRPSFPLASDPKGVTRPLWNSALASMFLHFRKCINPRTSVRGSYLFFFPLSRKKETKKELLRTQWYLDLCGGRFRAPP